MSSATSSTQKDAKETKQSKQALLIRPDLTYSVESIPSASMSFIQKAVGGNVEPLQRLKGCAKGIQAYCNEEMALSDKCLPNDLAAAVLEKARFEWTSICGLRGVLVVTGPATTIQDLAKLCQKELDDND